MHDAAPARLSAYFVVMWFGPAVFVTAPGVRRISPPGPVSAASGKAVPFPPAPWLVRLTSAAGIPLKSVGGRSWGCVSPALSSRPMLPRIGSKAALIARTVACSEEQAVCRRGGAPFVAWPFGRAGSVLMPVSILFSRSRDEGEIIPLIYLKKNQAFYNPSLIISQNFLQESKPLANGLVHSRL